MLVDRCVKRREALSDAQDVNNVKIEVDNEVQVGQSEQTFVGELVDFKVDFIASHQCVHFLVRFYPVVICFELREICVQRPVARLLS